MCVIPAASVGHHIFECLEFVTAQDGIQLGMHVFEIGVMPHARFEWPIDAWLFRIELPRMKINDNTLAVFFFKCTKRKFCKSRWGKSADIPHRLQENLCQESGELQEETREASAHLRMHACKEIFVPRHSIKIVMNGIDAGIVGKALFSQDVQRPEARFGN